MSDISEGDRDYVYSQLREAAIVIDEAEHSATLRKGDSNFKVASGMVRGWRRFIENAAERDNVVRSLKELDDDLGLVGGSATDAVNKARRLVADAHYRVASAR
jgi:hypothetical protein